MKSGLNANGGWLLLLLVIVAIIGVIWFLKSQGIAFGVEEEEYELTNEAMQQIAECRTYLVNQWICLLAFWFGIKTEQAQTKLVAPGPNRNGIYFFFQNIEIYAYFDWEKEQMEVKTSVYDEDDGYITHNKTFSIKNGTLESEKLFEFIYQAKEEHYGIYELSAEDVIGITKQLKISRQAFESEDAAKQHLFDNMADLMMLMRQKKFRNDKKLIKIYMGLIFWLWQQHGKDFLEYLEMSDEDFEPKQNANGGTNE